MTGRRSAKVHHVMSGESGYTVCYRHVTPTLQVTLDGGAVTCSACARESARTWAEAVHRQQQAQIRMCDMVIRGTIRLADGTMRVETMDIGHYMSQETLYAIRDAYLADDGDELQAVFDRSLTLEYMPGIGPVELLDVESMTFPGGGG
jgi:hypothetical protein